MLRKLKYTSFFVVLVIGFIKYVNSKNKLDAYFPDSKFKILSLLTCTDGDQRMLVHAIEIK